MDLLTSLGGAPPVVVNSAAPDFIWTMKEIINGYADFYDVISDSNAYKN